MLSRFSVKKPFTVVVAVILILILGTISFINLQTDLLPEISLPYLVLMTSYPGASPEEVEMLVTRPIEQVVATATNIKNISSLSRENSSLVIMEFNNEVNMDSAIIEINGSLDLIKGMWNDRVGNPMIIRLNPDMLPVMIASVDVRDMDIKEVSDYVNQKVISQLESINGVASVSGLGIVEETIEVFINPDKIDDLNKEILDKVDSELSQAEDELDKARNEIREGKVKLAEEEKKQEDKISEGERALASAKGQIQEGQEALDKGLEELGKKEKELEEGLKELADKEEELKSQEEGLLAIQDPSQEEKIKLGAVQEGLKGLLGKRGEIQLGLKGIGDKISDLTKEKAALVGTQEELAREEGQIKAGKEKLASEINKARQELIKGENTLNEKFEEFDQARDQAFEKASLDGIISNKMVSGILAAQNFSMPAGYVEEEGIDYLVKLGDKLGSIEEIGDLLLFDTGEEALGKIYLKDVADIGYKDNSSGIYAKVNGNNAVMLTIQKQSNFSTSELSKNIWERIEELTKEDKDLSITALMDQGEYIDIVVDSVLNNIIFGGILAILILLIFLRDIKPTFIIALSVPISIVFAIALMYFTGVTINIISLAGLALGVGMLVDNSIVVIENIYRLRNEGMPAVKAAVEGAREVSGAIIASTLTTACVFLPIVFTKGISRQIFTDMGLTIAYSLTASLIVALSLVPSLSASMLKKTTVKEGRIYKALVQAYEKMLTGSLKHRWLVISFAVLLLILSGYLGLSMGTSFIPDMDAPQMSLTISLDEESSFQEVGEMADNIIDRISQIEDIETIGAFFNQSGAGMGMGMGRGDNNSVSVYLLLRDKAKLSNAEIEGEILRLTEDFDTSIAVTSNNMDMSQLAGSGLEIQVKGREIDELQRIALEISKIVEETEGTIDVSSGIEDELAEVRIRVDKEKAMENGLTVAQVFSHINSLLARDQSATSLSLGNKDYPVIVIDGETKSIRKKDLMDISLPAGQEGEDREVLLGDIAKISEEAGLSSIRRDSQERYITVRAAIDKDHNIGLVSREVEKKLKDYEGPEGYKIEIAGENKMINDSLRDLFLMLLLAIAFIYLIMVAQFQSLLSPFIVMFTIPLAFTGGLLALAVSGNEISLISMLGFLVLAGVVVNNGIVFVDYTNQLRERGMEKDEALILAGKTRIKPILMTALTTILGLSTLAFGLGTGAEVLQPLAIVAIGGLSYATILTLFVVPAMYSILNRRGIRKFTIEED